MRLKLFNYNKENFGEETAIADLKGDLNLITEKIDKANKKLETSDTKTKIKTRHEIKDLADRKAKLEQLIPKETVNISEQKQENVPEIKPEVQEAKPVEEIKQPESEQKLQETPLVGAIKPKNHKSITKVQKQAYDLETSPTDDRAIVMKHFVSGGKLHPDTIEGLFGNKTPGNKKVLAERRARFTWTGKDGQTVDQIAHSLWEDYGHDANGNQIEGMTDQDFREEIESVIGDYTSPIQMARDIIKTYGEKEQQISDEEIEAIEKNRIENEPLDEDVINFVQQSSNVPEEYIPELEKYYDLTPEEATELNNYFHESTKEPDKGSENSLSAKSKESASNEEIKGTAGEEKSQEITVYQKQIDELTAQRTKLAADIKKKTKAFDNRNGIFGDQNTEPNDMFGGAGFDASAGNKVIKDLSDQIKVIDTKIEDLKKLDATGKKEGQAQAELPIPDIHKQISAQNVNENPTPAQKEAGNYKMAHVTVHGMDITIENPKGSIRSGTDDDGNDWSNKIKSHYGYFKQTEGKDGDHIDTFIGANPDSKKVFVVDQVNPKTGEFDESKVMLGYNSIEEARKGYLENYDEGWKGLSNITESDIEPFKKWLNDGLKQRKPYAEYNEVKNQIPDAGKMVDPIHIPKEELDKFDFKDEDITEAKKKCTPRPRGGFVL